MIIISKDYTLQYSKKFRKKPIVVSAEQMLDEFKVETLEGTMQGKKGDYLIRGINGELYPCDSNIFKKTYEVVKDWISLKSN